DDYLVSSVGLSYQERPTGAQLTGVVAAGHRRLDDGTFLERTRPPLDLEYSPSPFDAPGFAFTVADVDEVSARNLPAGWDGRAFRLGDLDGDGVAGVLAERPGGWFYKPNLGDGRLGPARLMAARPGAAETARHQLVDLAGDGRPDLVTFDP